MINKKRNKNTKQKVISETGKRKEEGKVIYFVQRQHLQHEMTKQDHLTYCICL